MDFQFAHVTYTRFDEPKVKSSTQNASIENAELTLGTTSAMWRSRGYLPHFDRKGCIQSITFRLSDSLPKAKLDQLESIVAILPTETDREQATRAQIEKWLDAGMGSCALKHQAVAKKVEDALLYFDGDRYKLIAWCIMPNHVHVLIEQMEKLPKIIQSWKSYTGRWAKQRSAELELGVPKDRPFWMREYWDRYIRNRTHLNKVIEYIHLNPVKAHLCSTPADWLYSSARHITRNAELPLGTTLPTHT